MPENKFGGLGNGSMPGGRDMGIGPTGPDDDGEESRKGSDMSGATAADSGGKNKAQPAEEGARIDESPSASVKPAPN